MFDYLPLITGIISPISPNLFSRIIEETIKWSDSRVEHEHADSSHKFVSCIKLINHTRLERHLYTKENGNIVLVDSQIITDSIDKLDLPEEHLKELRRQGYIIAKVYE